MKTGFGYALGAAAALAWAAPALAETNAERVLRLESELQAARNAQAAELEAQAALLRSGGAVLPGPAGPPANAAISNGNTSSGPKESAAAERVRLAKDKLTYTISGAGAPGGPLAMAGGGGDAGAEIATAAEELGEAKAEDAKEAEAGKDFMGLGLGVGLSFTLGLGDDRITDAALDPNGIVRVSDQDNAIARVMLEAHQFFGLDDGETADDGTVKHRFGIGPFVAIQPGDGEVIDAIGGGVMFGFRPDSKSSKSFNLGLGVVVDPNTQLLGDGILPNQPLPAGETEIRFKKTASYGALLLTSFSF